MVDETREIDKEIVIEIGIPITCITSSGFSVNLAYDRTKEDGFQVGGWGYFSESVDIGGDLTLGGSLGVNGDLTIDDGNVIVRNYNGSGDNALLLVEQAATTGEYYGAKFEYNSDENTIYLKTLVSDVEESVLQVGRDSGDFTFNRNIEMVSNSLKATSSESLFRTEVSAAEGIQIIEVSSDLVQTVLDENKIEVKEAYIGEVVMLSKMRIAPLGDGYGFSIND